MKKNILIVTNIEKNPELFRSSIQLEGVKWITGVPKLPFKTNVKIRYRHPAVCAIINTRDKKQETRDKIYEVEFDESQKAVTPGQSAVFYSNKGEVIGGGIIKK